MPTAPAPGFRLTRFEVYNWGTFHERAWVIALDQANGLLTGDIGSGKSTLVDGLTTLLVPAHRVIYNRAAGAEAKERSLATYVRGHYKAALEDASQAARAVALREQNTYSVLLARFENDALAEGVTLAQVFWMHEHKATPERFYVVASRDMAIATDFASFGADIKDLKRRLRGGGAELFDAFAPYGQELRRRLGIASEQALMLFYQTVSMKAVGNLTDFIRHHMLEPPAARERLEALCREFDDVNRAYEAVRKAKAQVAALEPLVADLDRRAEEVAKRERKVAARDVLASYFAELEVKVLEERLERYGRDLAGLDERLVALEEEQTTLEHRCNDLKLAIADQGGRRLEEIRRELEALTKERDRIRAEADRYAQACEALGLGFPSDAEAFYERRTALAARRGTTEHEAAALDEEAFTVRQALSDMQQRHQALSDELASLRSRRSSIPTDSLALRGRLLEAIGVDEAELPFAGELMRVRDTEGTWEGAAERLLHSFALSLLVPEALYAQVASYVERTHLRGRLVYYKVTDRGVDHPAWPPEPRALAHKIETREHRFRPWLEAELARRCPHVCTADMDEFRRLREALTPQGQIKGGGQRHEKDDRHRLDDRTRYVLGWTNEAKIRALETEASKVGEQGTALVARRQALEARKGELQRQRDLVLGLERTTEYAQLNWAPAALQITQLEAERAALEAGSDALQVLQAQLVEATAQLSRVKADGKAAQDEHGQLKEKCRGLTERRDSAATAARLPAAEARTACYPQLAAWQAEALGDKRPTVENVGAMQRELRDWLQARIDAVGKVLERLDPAIVRRMTEFKASHPQASLEMDAHVDAGDEYRACLARLVHEDLPRHEGAFKTMLNQNTIQGLAMFRNWLEKEFRDIEDKVAAINRSLHAIHYNPGTYIELVSTACPDVEIRDFRQELRACMTDALSGGEDELYAEGKFLQVKRLIDKFRGREGLADVDRLWTTKVIDVRNWLTFGARERWLEDGAEKEYYADSAGKSGGQKEKLAYTILASALAYQYGLEKGGARAFRFVMIDEAFGRGSDDSARYGLELFERMGLQLLVVTPFQKIHVIADHVRSVHLAFNPDGRISKVQSLTIEEYVAAKQLAGAGASS